MGFYFAQFLTGLASAASLFLVASGLSIIFGVTRIVNFAHGSFYMLGAYLAYTLVDAWQAGPLGFWGAVVIAAGNGPQPSSRPRATPPKAPWAMPEVAWGRRRR